MKPISVSLESAEGFNFRQADCHGIYMYAVLMEVLMAVLNNGSIVLSGTLCFKLKARRKIIKQVAWRDIS